MKQSIKVLMAFKILLTLLFIVNLCAPAVFAADTAAKMNKHKSKGIACAACHKDSTEARVKDNTCMSCHGSYAELAKKTAKLEDLKAHKYNPHRSHVGEASCTLCHKNHAPSVLYCNECHPAKFTMKVP